MSVIVAAGLAAWDAGLSVLPAKTDGSKAPRTFLVPEDCTAPRCVATCARAEAEGRRPFGWKHWTHDRLSRRYLERELHRSDGICIVCGEVSRNLLMLETDTPDMADRLREEAERAGWSDVMERLDAGYRERTPKGGTHWLLRLTERVPGNTKLARRPKRPEEMEDEGDKVQVLIETRGEGGQVVVAPSHGRTHPSGKSYVLEAGGFETIPLLSSAEWTGIASAASRLDEMPEMSLRKEHRKRPYEGDSIMDEFNARASWAEILEPHGWVLAEELGDSQYWRRPGKADGISASINDDGDGPMYVFTTSTVFTEGEAYSKFAAWAVLNKSGDFKEAARAIGGWKRESTAS